MRSEQWQQQQKNLNARKEIWASTFGDSPFAYSALQTVFQWKYDEGKTNLEQTNTASHFHSAKREPSTSTVSCVFLLFNCRCCCCSRSRFHANMQRRIEANKSRRNCYFSRQRVDYPTIVKVWLNLFNNRVLGVDSLRFFLSSLLFTSLCAFHFIQGGRLFKVMIFFKRF